MGLLVDVSIAAASIVDAAWERATANRERLRRRLDVQAVREEPAVNRINGRSSGLGWEQRYTTPTPLQYRPDEPVAYPSSSPRPATYPAAVGYTALEFNGGPGDNTIRVWPAEGDIPVSVSLPNTALAPLGSDEAIELRPQVPYAGGSPPPDGTVIVESDLPGSGSLTYDSGASIVRHYGRYQSVVVQEFQLPVGKSLMIHCVWSRQRVKTAVFDSVELGFTGEWVSIGPHPVTGENRLRWTNTAQGPNYPSLAITDDTDFTVGKCVLVGKRSAREIPMPGALLDLLDTIYPPPSFVEPVPFIASGPDSLGQVSYGIFFYADGSGFIQPGPCWDIAMQKPSRWRFGAGCGAGIFKTLRNPSEIDDPESQSNADAEAFLESENPPGFELVQCALDGSCDAERQSFDILLNPGGDPPAFKRNAASTWRPGDGSLSGLQIAAWDWGKRAYCREQLLDLGFRPEDLAL